LIITVSGAVKKKGTFPFASKMTVGQAIDLAEGLTPLGDPESIIVSQNFVQNNNGSIITTSKNVSNVTLDLVLNENASITVLKYKDMVNITGNVYNPGLIAYKQGTTVKNYIKLAGGYRENSLKNKIYIQSTDGKISKVGRGLFKRLKSGDTIVIPIDSSPPPDFDTAGFTADIVAILTNLATIIFIINSNSN
jgi:protein involved in polysaccharide export with SLBB domain